MTLYNRRKDKLMNDLEDREYRQAFVSSHISTGIAFQIRAMRGDLTQGKFGELTHMKQEQISRLEDPDNEMLSVKTLLRLAAARDVALVVRFVPFGDLVKWDLNLSDKSLEVPSFGQDPYFKETGNSLTTADSTEYPAKLFIQGMSDNVIYIRDRLDQQRSDLPVTDVADRVALSY